MRRIRAPSPVFSNASNGLETRQKLQQQPDCRAVATLFPLLRREPLLDLALAQHLQRLAPRDELVEHRLERGCLQRRRLEHAEILEIGEQRQEHLRSHGRDL